VLPPLPTTNPSGAVAEGYDPLVLDGAMPVLSGNRVRVLMFEYHGIGVWKQQSVHLKVCTPLITSPFFYSKWTRVGCMSAENNRALLGYRLIHHKRQSSLVLELIHARGMRLGS
jgi:hypothetical protein